MQLKVYTNNMIVKYIVVGFVLILIPILFQPAAYSNTDSVDASHYIRVIVTCKYIEDNEPHEITTNFSVYDIIHIFTSWQNMKGTHTVEGYWYNPYNELRDIVPVFIESKTGFYKTWFWFKLGADGKSKFLGFDSNLSRSIGKWCVVIYLDGKFIKKLNFVVS